MRFRVVVADPPWSFSDSLGSRGADDKYEVLTIDDIAALPVADVMLDDSVCFMWFVASQTEEACRVMRDWGFRQTQIWTWDKRRRSGKRHMGMGRLGRNSSEHLLVGVRGKTGKYLKNKRTRTIFDAQVPVDENGKIVHSAKPERFQSIVQRLLPGPYLELFARRQRAPWTCLGNECPGDGLDIRDSLSALRWAP